MPIVYFKNKALQHNTTHKYTTLTCDSISTEMQRLQVGHIEQTAGYAVLDAIDQPIGVRQILNVQVAIEEKITINN